MKGTFRAYGEFETGPSFPVVPAVALVVAFAVVSALAVILLWLAAILLVLLGFAVAAAVMMRRRYPDHSEQVAADLRSFRAEVTAPKAARVVEHHHYVHPLPGVTAGEADWALPLRDAVIKED